MILRFTWIAQIFSMVMSFNHWSSVVDKQLRVAIIGGGFAGLSVAQRLAPFASHISILDMMPPGKAGASAAAGGLLHPLSSRGGFVWRGVEGYMESKHVLMQLAHTAVDKENLYQYPVEILRPLLKASDAVNWQRAADTSSKEWLELVSNDEFQIKTGIRNEGKVKVIKIKNAIIVNPTNYLLSLWENVLDICPSSIWKLTCVEDLEGLTELSNSYDVVVVAAGPSLQNLWSDRPEHQFFLKYVKGQNQIYNNDELRVPLLSGEYIVPRKSDVTYLVCGATHQHIHPPTLQDLQELMTTSTTELDSNEVISNDADATLRSRLCTLYPKLKESHPIQLTSGVRLVTERTELGKIPIVGRHPWLKNVWTISGLGARGLVYHALMSRYLHRAILDNNENLHIPKPLQPSSHYLLKEK